MKKLTRTLVAASALGVLCLAGNAQASTLLDFGFGAGNEVNTLDWLPGTAYAKGGNFLLDLQNPAASVFEKDFDLYYQAKLGQFVDVNGDAIDSSVTGMGNAAGKYELTVVAGFREHVSFNPADGTATFSMSSSTEGPNFFNVYKDFNVATRANALNGTGYADGALVISGTVMDSKGNFTNNSAKDGLPYDLLDKSGENNWGTQMTVQGTGGTDVIARVDTYDTTFIISPFDLLALNFQLFNNTSNNLPFFQVNPSRQYWDGTALVGTVGTLGAVNGDPIFGSENIMFQADANTSFDTVPEPSTFVLSGLGLLLAGGFLRRRRNG